MGRISTADGSSSYALLATHDLVRDDQLQSSLIQVTLRRNPAEH